MWLGKRSARGWTCDGGQLTRWVIGLVAFGSALLACPDGWMAGARANEAIAVTAGPGRIVCNASFCQLGSGARPKERFRVIVSDLPREEIRRLRKCTGVAKPCIVTVDGVEQGNPMRIMATAIRWQE